jgi:hypothetical protein
MIHLSHLINDPKEKDICIIREEFSEICSIPQIVERLRQLRLRRVARLLVAHLFNIAQEFVVLQCIQLYPRTLIKACLIIFKDEWVLVRVHRRYDLFGHASNLKRNIGGKDLYTYEGEAGDVEEVELHKD